MEERSGRQRGIQPIRPRRRLYLAALLAAVAAAVLAVVASTAGGFPSGWTRVAAPGTAELTLAEPGTYTIGYEHRTPEGFDGGGAPSEVRSMHLELVST